MSTCLNVCMVRVIAYLAWRNEQKETYVFVRDGLGNVVQDAQSFLHAGDARTEAEIKGFMRRWVFDTYSWTPLDVEDRLRAALRLVETKAQPASKPPWAWPSASGWSRTAPRAESTRARTAARKLRS